MKIKGLYKEYVDIEVDTLQNIENVILDLFKHSYRDLIILNDCLYYQEDISYHGSPIYKNHLISNEQNWVSVFKYLNEVRQILLNNDCINTPLIIQK